MNLLYITLWKIEKDVVMSTDRLAKWSDKAKEFFESAED
jgi:hypothetical protein